LPSRWPLVVEHRERNGVSPRTIVAEFVFAKYAFAGRAQPRYRSLRALVSDIGVPHHSNAAERLEGMGQQQPFGLGVQPCSPESLAKPGVPDGDRAKFGVDVVVTRHPGYLTGTQIDLGPRDQLAVRQSAFDSQSGYRFAHFVPAREVLEHLRGIAGKRQTGRVFGG